MVALLEALKVLDASKMAAAASVKLSTKNK